MLDTFREHSKGWLAKLILALITVPFALWGIDSYLHQAGSSVAVAKVNGHSITVQEYSTALQNLRNQMQASGKADPALFEDPAFKQSVLDRLIVSRLLGSEVRRANFALSDEQLAKFILGLPEFQQDGKFSQELYDNILKQNQMSPSQFESRMRNELLIQQARDGLVATAFLPRAVSDNISRVQRQQREVSVAEIKTADFLNQVRVDDPKIKAYYEQHKDRFQVPEQVRIEYVLLSANNFIPAMQVTEEEAKKFYTENLSKFQGDEQRRASHILIGFGKGDAAAKKAAHEKALSILAEVRKFPEKFAELAKQYSQDPGSAQNGGDLGLFGRGMMVKPFEDAVFSMSPGAISDLVESEFGYHIIKLTEIKGQSQTFDDVKANIRAELMYQKALAKFAEQAENFSNMVYEQSDSLEPVVKAFGLQVQTSQWMSRDDAMKFFKSDKLVNAIFSDEVLKDKRNTEAVEVAPNTLVSARVLEHKPAAPRAYEEVASGIAEYLKQEQSAALAAKKGAEVLTALRQGREVPGLEWTPPVVVDRKNAQGLTDAVMRHVFKVNVDKLPAYGGFENAGLGYTLLRVTQVKTPENREPAEQEAEVSEMRAAIAEEYVAAYVASLKAKASISFNKQLLGAQ